MALVALEIIITQTQANYAAVVREYLKLKDKLLRPL
jgi:hypothetical protein